MTRSIAVGMGLMEFPFSGAGAYWDWVDLCEAGGVDSLWQTDRLVSRAPILESVTTMAALAGRTRRIKFGVNVVSMALRDPVLLAKQLATVDMLAEGRLLPAFGVGSPLGPEWKTLHIDTSTRGKKTDEGLEILSRLWREERVDFAGEHYQLTGASISPKPVQPDLPIWIGGSSKVAIARTVRFGTGWQAGRETPEQVAPVVAEIAAAAAAAGRPIDEDHYGAGFPVRLGTEHDPGVKHAMDTWRKRTGQDPHDHFAVGDADAIMARIAAYVEAGISKFILRPAGEGDADILQQTRRLIDEVLPLVAARWPRPRKEPKAVTA